MSKHFVRAGKRIDIKAPDGTFHLKVASGEEWYGEPYLFGPDTLLYALTQPLKYGEDQAFIVQSVEVNIPVSLNDESRQLQGDRW